MKYYSAIKKNEIIPFTVTQMDAEIIILSKSKTNMRSPIYGIKKKKEMQMNLFTKHRQSHKSQKQIYGYQRENVGRRDKLRIWD